MVKVEITFVVQLDEDQVDKLGISTDPGEEEDEAAIAEGVRDLFADDPAEFMDEYRIVGKVRAEVI